MNGFMEDRVMDELADMHNQQADQRAFLQIDRSRPEALPEAAGVLGASAQPAADPFGTRGGRGAEPPKYTEQQLGMMPDWIETSKRMHRVMEGYEFIGSDKQAAAYGMDLMAEFNWNMTGPAGFPGEAGISSPGLIGQIWKIVNSAGYVDLDDNLVSKEDNADDFLFMLDTYADTKTEGATIKRSLRALFGAPETYGSIGGGIAAPFIKAAAMKSSSMTARQMLMGVAKAAGFATDIAKRRPVASGAAVGAAYADLGEGGRMILEGAAGMPPSLGDAVKRTVVAGLTGAGVGAGLAKTADVAVREFGPPIREGIASIGEAAEARMARNQTPPIRQEPDLGLPDDIQPRYFEPGKFEPPTAENPVSVVLPTETEPGIIAFHGSAADFDKFKLQFIGTGEGAQAYGYGLYFTDSEDIARFYKDALGSENLVLPSGQTVRTTNLGDMAVVEDALPSELEQLGVINQAPDGTARYNKPSVLIAEAIGEAGSDDLVGNTRKYLETKLETESSFERQRLGFTKAEGDALEQANINALAAFDKMVEAGIETKTGKIYKVAITPKPEEMLDYQTTFADQPQSVQDALRAIGYDTETASTIEKNGDGRHTVFYIDTKGREARQDFIDGVAGQTSEQQAKEFAAKQDEMRSKLPMPVVLDALKGTLKKQMEAGEMPVDRPDKVLSERLSAEGVPGIKYRAAGSRAASVDAADAEMNYVIFDENAIKILEKYGIVGPVAITAVAAGQGADSDEGEVM
jgi:hypothetical protein